MNRYYIERAIVAALGFLVGAALAMAIVPGDVLALIGTGIVLGFSARALFDQDFGGGWFWPFSRTGWHEGPGSTTTHRAWPAVAGLQMTHEPKQRIVKQARSVPKSYGVGPSPEIQASPEPRNVVAEDVQADLNESNQMISEGSPTR